MIPAGTVDVTPVLAVVFHNYTGVWRNNAIGICVRARFTIDGAGRSPNPVVVRRSGSLVARFINGGVDGFAIWRHGKAARCHAKQGDDFFHLGIGGIEYPDIGTVCARRHGIKVRRRVLTAMRGRHKSAGIVAASKDNVLRFITDMQRFLHVGQVSIQFNDTDVIREVIDHPGLVIIAQSDGNRLNPDGNAVHQRRGFPADIKNFEFAIRRVQRVQAGVV